MRLSQIDSLMSRCQTDENGCWVYQGHRDVNGYGKTSRNYKSAMVHRVVYEELVGPIPEGLQIDHLCRNRSCCNPEHLEPVTRAENAARTLPGERGKYRAALESAKTHCPRGHAYDEQNTYTNAKGHRWCRACRREIYAERKAA